MRSYRQENRPRRSGARGPGPWARTEAPILAPRPATTVRFRDLPWAFPARRTQKRARRSESFEAGRRCVSSGSAGARDRGPRRPPARSAARRPSPRRAERRPDRGGVEPPHGGSAPQGDGPALNAGARAVAGGDDPGDADPATRAQGPSHLRPQLRSDARGDPHPLGLAQSPHRGAQRHRLTPGDPHGGDGGRPTCRGGALVRGGPPRVRRADQAPSCASAGWRQWRTVPSSASTASGSAGRPVGIPRRNARVGRRVSGGAGDASRRGSAAHRCPRAARRR